jgi:hypothetical protein
MCFRACIRAVQHGKTAKDAQCAGNGIVYPAFDMAMTIQCAYFVRCHVLPLPLPLSLPWSHFLQNDRSCACCFTPHRPADASTRSSLTLSRSSIIVENGHMRSFTMNSAMGNSRTMYADACGVMYPEVCETCSTNSSSACRCSLVVQGSWAPKQRTGAS